jgi:hypothetical protein
VIRHPLPTLRRDYFKWNESRPFHIDYCFVPQAWVGSGTYADWAKGSDHRPVVVDVADE